MQIREEKFSLLIDLLLRATKPINLPAIALPAIYYLDTSQSARYIAPSRFIAKSIQPYIVDCLDVLFPMFRFVLHSFG